MSRGRPDRPQDGFTLVELLIAMVLMGVFGLVLLGFFTASSNQATTHRNQAVAQQDARTAIELMSRELRQAVMPDTTGAMPPIESMSPTSIVFHIDPRRTAGNLGHPVPDKVRYRIDGDDLVREVAKATGTSPPFTFGAYTGTTVIAADVANGSVPLFSGADEYDAALPATLNSTQTDQLAVIDIELRLDYKTGQSDRVFEISTTVVPRNPRSAT